MSEQQKLGKIQKAKTFYNQIEKKINENILFRTLLWGNKIGRLLENY
jgi:DNA-binding transcriptional regulator YhcF (GntR family)